MRPGAEGGPFEFSMEPASLQPIYSLASAAFAHSVAVFLFAYLLTRREAKPRLMPWLNVGIAFGVAMLTRWQLGLTPALCAGVLLARRQWRPLYFMIVGWLFLSWNIPYSLKWKFGSFFSVPVDALGAGRGFLGLPADFIPALLSGEHAWLVFAPVAALAPPGLVILFRRHRVLALTLLAIVGAQAALNLGSSGWAGTATPALWRAVDLYPLGAAGAGVLLSTAGQAWGSRGRGRLPWPWTAP